MNNEAEYIAIQTGIVNAMTEKQLDELANELQWTSYGLDGKGPAKTNSFSELEISHLENILVMLGHCLSTTQRKLILHILKTRKVL